MPKATSSESVASLNQFPFRRASPAALGRAVLDHEALIRACVRRRLPRRHEPYLDDLEQDVRLAVLRALPHFDASHGFRLGTYLYRVIHRTVSRELRRLDRSVSTGPVPCDLTAPDTHDAAGLAESIIRDPRAYLTRRQAQLLALLGAGADRQFIADSMGIDVDSVARATVRLRNRIAQLSI